MRYVSGLIFQGEEFEKGYIGFEEGVVKETGKGAKRDAVAKGIIIPTFVNAHTHIADAVIKDEITGSLKELVAPPDGLKHRVLRETPREILIQTMKEVARNMLNSGIEHFCDFREGGIEGVKILHEALSGSPLVPCVFGRPSGMKYVADEMEELLGGVDGIGLSSISDWEDTDIEEIARHTKRNKKNFALHASERIREDIDAVLDLEPDFLIHMNEATESDLELCAENDVPIVICPRSEMFFGHIPNISLMLRKGICLALGTDNAMLNAPHSVLREMEFAFKISRLRGEVTAMDILKMVLQNPRKVLNVGEDIRPTSGKEANFIVFEVSSKNPAYALINGASAHNISLISVNNYLWMRRSGK